MPFHRWIFSLPLPPQVAFILWWRSDQSIFISPIMGRTRCRGAKAHRPNPFPDEFKWTHTHRNHPLSYTLLPLKSTRWLGTTAEMSQRLSENYQTLMETFLPVRRLPFEAWWRRQRPSSSSLRRSMLLQCVSFRFETKLSVVSTSRPRNKIYMKEMERKLRAYNVGIRRV